MTILLTFWLPILLSSVFVFLASALIHMVLQSWHGSDYAKLREEDKVMEALRPLGLPPGHYMVPKSSGAAEMKTPEFAEKLKKGPVLVMTVMPNGMMNMGKSLAVWFLYIAVVNFFAAYVSGHALSFGAPFRQVCRFAGLTSFLGYAAALWQIPIWGQRSWTATVKLTVDGILYAVITAATFGWLWPR